ncbi:MAG: HAMP domain-containing histidine kinase, partial [Bdellovibrionales bacterium]|nr:HAMP domain-containing histidine kinase [Bdellovibrionales bacterium]
LTVIDLHAAKLKKYETEYNLSPNVMYSIDKIQVMIKRIGKIIKGLKTLARDGNRDPMIPFLVANMLEDVHALIEMKLKTNGIDFEIKIENKNLEVIGREVQISQVMVNLIGNAIDAIMDHGNENKWIKVEVNDKEECVFISVTDSGEGISEELLEKIMHPFFTTKDATRGTGLGLSISKDIIEEHGGKLEYNRYFKNTQFVFSIKKGNSTQDFMEKSS